jgi:hypothetical protein
MAVLDDAYLKDLARARSANVWLGGMAALGVLAFLLHWFHATTELAPTHDGAAQFCAIAAALVCLASAVVGFRKHPFRGVVDRLFRAVGYGLLGFVAVFFASKGCATTIEGWIDFPAGGTRASQGLIAIADASHSVGVKGQEHWTMETQKFDATLNITREDYGFMLAHRRPEDDASEPDRIASNGFFCARVTIEQAGEALRILHAGSYKLPQGSVMLCPAKRTT